MPQDWYTLCEIKRDYEIASLNDVIDCAKQAGVPARRGAAKVTRSQLRKMHPHLMKVAKRGKHRDAVKAKGSRVVYDSAESDEKFFTAVELVRHLNPLVEERDQDAG